MLIPVLVVIIVCIIFFKIQSATKDVDYILIKRQNAASTVLTTGKVTSDKILNVKSEIKGSILSSKYDEGDRFKKGDELAKFDDTDQRQALNQAELNLKMMKNRLDSINKKDFPEAEEAVIQAQLNFQKSKEDYEKKEYLFKSMAVS